ncbi:conserved hypothetical protein [Candida dubliniensis CD36]|uniref:Uncharacterized protein n=1 Tax=Candida dubliniensis (strain CD36 / ATCC MYA-646 / CBS 7987 / NCPF 3949 / NRRL Y-17841) TaxID=573826 RepID=B9WI97_CANDC|nr:conserved hypothetical protein [Candida dubliniensis CD36]CAX40959.1 conserved hypothetical protein [Candida dubliniensis CD36]
MDELFDANATILQLLPSTLPGLIEKPSIERSFNHDKAAVLTMLLGSKFTNALDLALSSQISGDLSNLTFTQAGLQLPTHTDMTNWYCNCIEYQSCYTSNMDITTIAGTSWIHQILGTHVLSPIPICSHILAILIIKYNPQLDLSSCVGQT